MTLYAQKYNNTIRTVNGTVFVEIDDVVLMVDTSTIPATIILQDFVANHWSTQYKLYVVDGSNNATANNIMIVAPTGFTINGQSSIIIVTNGGSCIVRIVANTEYIGELSGSGSGATPFFYAKKMLQNASTTYVPVTSAGTFSVYDGVQITSFDTMTNQGVNGFNLSTGFWTVPYTGWYTLGAKMVTRINNAINTTHDSIGNFWTLPTCTYVCDYINYGYMSIGLIVNKITVAPGQIITAEKQVVSQHVSDINIECTQNVYQFTAGDQIGVYVLNKTDHNVVGIAFDPREVDCYLDFSVKKIG